MKNNYIFQTKIIYWEEWHCFTFFKPSLMPGVTETTGFLYLLLHSVCCSMFFWLEHMKKTGLHKDEFGKDLVSL